MKNYLPFVILTLVATGAIAQTAFDDGEEVTQKCYFETCELTGDFNGDGQKDTAVLVANKEGKKGIKITFGGSDKVIILGAGRTQGTTATSKDVSGTTSSSGNGGDDFSWMTGWSLEAKNFRRPGHKGVPHVLRGHALNLARSPTSHVRVYWNGTNSIWDEVE